MTANDSKPCMHNCLTDGLNYPECPIHNQPKTKLVLLRDNTEIASVESLSLDQISRIISILNEPKEN